MWEVSQQVALVEKWMSLGGMVGTWQRRRGTAKEEPIQSGGQPVRGAAAASEHLADGAGACTGPGAPPAGRLGRVGAMAPCQAARSSARSTGHRTPRPAAAPASFPSGAGCRTKRGPPDDMERCVCLPCSPMIQTCAKTTITLTSRSRPRSSEM